MTFIAFDPGPHTGIARFDSHGTVEKVWTLEQSAMSTRALYCELQWIISSIPTYETGTIVIERFRTASPAVAAGMAGVMTAKLCGFIEGVGYLYGYPVIEQTSAMRMPFVDAAKALKIARTPHELSAIAHGLCYWDRVKSG